MIRTVFEHEDHGVMSEVMMSYPPRIGDQVDFGDVFNMSGVTWGVTEVTWDLSSKLVDSRGRAISTLRVKVN